MIVPRDFTGAVDHDNGLIGIVSIGFSNVRQEFGDLIEDRIQDLQTPFDGLNDKLVFVNGGKDNNTMCDWEVDPVVIDSSNIWGELVIEKLDDGKVPGGGVGFTAVDPDQVQAVWIKMVIARPWKYCTEHPNFCEGADPCAPALCGDPACRFPNWMDHSTDGEIAKYKTVLKHIRTVFPNIAQVFLSSRMYGGYANEVDGAVEQIPPPCGQGSPEPWAYESGFSAQGVIKSQAFDGGMDFGAIGVHPYVAWAPYYWANGTTPNPDGLTWECWQVCADGAHPSRDEDVDPGQTSGQTQVADLLYDFFKTHALASEWYLERPLIVSSTPPDGFIDPLEDRDGETGLIPQGITEITIEFDKPVFDLGTGGPLVIGSFVVASTGGSPPTVTAVDPVVGVPDAYKLTLSGPIEPGQWTTVFPQIKDAEGNLLRSDPWNRVVIGFLPGDVDGSAKTEKPDHANLSGCLINPQCASSAPMERYDIDRDADFDAADKTRLEELLRGDNSSQAWVNVSLPAQPVGGP
ncbi:MAG: hypothetical protein IID37_11055 [Planctomycetes bacterium]|nr:hypothetical protein [Planctomycetota bacterium]